MDLNFNPQILVPDFSVNFGSTVIDNIAGTQVLAANPNRVTLMLSNTSTGLLSFNFQSFTNLVNGFQLPTTANPVILTYKDLGALIGYPLFGFCSMFGSTLNWVEVIYTPKR